MIQQHIRVTLEKGDEHDVEFLDTLARVQASYYGRYISHGAVYQLGPNSDGLPASTLILPVIVEPVPATPAIIDRSKQGGDLRRPPAA